ncbi:MAG: hypothetical protein A2519_15790 [Candidatus Raymondbacteria bacterium RIFOXYD12_FULL_49_13]|uniref:RHS repeat-associated core domain-containing protein n=1 Tax=Candidatus Raymondbacteria bacterium RIFOXYD12_FULL_49_13 TaxID=1817890 RepID=A0A1F7FCZ5_UNCRA|nr:MAG: hypothetical protein A2519_15790 [Candidatus Raymondbacteria bacterium RIFOXYD12_FULL_49_13]
MGYIRIETNGTSADELWYLIGARYFDFDICRWLGPDPWMFDELRGLSPYVYCHNNPINKIDSDGRFVWVASPAAVYLIVRAGSAATMKWQNIHPLLKAGAAAVLAGIAKGRMSEDDAAALDEALKTMGPEGEFAGVASEGVKQSLDAASGFISDIRNQPGEPYDFPQTPGSLFSPDISNLNIPSFYNIPFSMPQISQPMSNAGNAPFTHADYMTLEEIRDARESGTLEQGNGEEELPPIPTIYP